MAAAAAGRRAGGPAKPHAAAVDASRAFTTGCGPLC